MCGIFAILGIKNCYPHMIEGLKILQNRGYDSAGICSIINNKFVLDKFATCSQDSIEKLEDKNIREKHKDAYLSISHTRWATHGIKSDNNSHPHIDFTKIFSIVHNGIIDNYKSIKKFLVLKGYIFKSETDTEVLVNLISFNYHNKTDMALSYDDRVIVAIQLTLKEISGTFGICLLCLNCPNSVYIFRRGSPLVFADNNNSLIIASEQSAIQKYTNKYKIPKEDQIIKFTYSGGSIKYDQVFKDLDENSIELINFNNSLDEYSHWTIKEINDINVFSKLAINQGGRIENDNKVKLGGLEKYKDLLSIKENIILLGCGSSLLAAKYVQKYLMVLNISNNIQCINACEFDLDEFNDAFLEKTLFIFISQSGETYDLIKILNNINNLGYLSLGVVNKTGSYISQHTSCGVYVNSGNEVAVAATKSFVNQVVVLLLIGLYISQNKNTNQLFRARIINSIKQFCFEKININEIEKQLTSIVDEIYKSNNMFILGSSFCEAIAGEGSLKIKELTYIHSEAYSMGELKHGPLSLICDNIPVIFFYLKDNKHNDRIISSLSETKLRGSYNILITDYVELGEKFDTKNIDKIITVENRGILTPLMGLIPLQLLAYYTSIKKGINPDKPRNLAKTVTVE